MPGGGAGPAVIVIVPEVAAVRPVALKLSVRSPAGPVIARFVKLATPLPFVVAVSVPPSVPPPVAIAAVTVTPAWLTALPLASRNCTTGCRANATPLCAVADGAVLIVSCVAAPAVAVALKLTGDPAPVACTVCVPAVVPSVQVVVAMPLPLLVDVVGLTDPLPVAGVHVTETPPTGLLNRSATRTESCVGKVVPTVPVCPSPPAGVICDAPAAVALILNVTVVSLPAIVAVAVVVCVPINIPTVRNVCACPFASAVRVAGLTDPPPPHAAAHLTVPPATGFPVASLTGTPVGG